MIEEIDLEPAVKPEDMDELDKKENQFPDLLPSRIFKHSVKVTCEGKVKALFLKANDNKAPIPESHYKPALTVLDAPWKMFPWRPAKNCGRPMIKQQWIGGDYTFGFLPPRSFKENYLRPGTRDTLHHELMLGPLVRDLERAMRVHLPHYYQFHMYQAEKLLRPPGEVLVKNPWKVGDPFQREQLEKMKDMGYAHVLGCRAFSTLTLNSNLLFGMHGDGHNMPYTLSCLTALGDFVGGELCFPRLGIGFDVQPYDVLISDTNNEYHCSSRMFIGKRITIVAYLHSGVDRGWRFIYRDGRPVGLKQDKSLKGSIDSWLQQVQEGGWLWEERNRRKPRLMSAAAKSTKPLPFEYTPNFLTKEEANELAAYFDTVRFHVRKTRWGHEIKRQSLGYIAQNAFNDRDQKEWGTEYADIETMPEILQRFRRKLAQHVGKEINYVSILKYPNSDATINWHNHREDHWHDSPVWDVTIGPTERKFWAREVANPKETVTSVLAEVGSLVTLPASMNTTHEHAILRDKTTGVRYSINCKSLPLYGVWDCHEGKNYPKKGVNFHEDAVHVGCRVVRGGKVIKEGSIYGNATDPLACRDGAFKTEREFRKYAERRMQDPEFRARVRAELKGKHLLCWCVQSGPKRDEFCHARVWLELANRD